MGIESLALHYVPEGYSVDGQRLMGRQAAGAGFLQAVARERPVRLYAYSPQRAFAEHLAGEMRRLGAENTAVEWLPVQAHARLGMAGLLYVPDPSLTGFAWRRARSNPSAYSLCGVTHTTMSKMSMEFLTSMALSPMEHWDALICTSRAVHQSIDELLRVQADFLRRRLDARRMPIPQLPIIPLGVHANEYVLKQGEREAARLGLGIDDDEIVLIYVGRLSFHAKAHHLPMLLAAEEAARGHKVVLLQAGWFANDKIESIYREEGAEFAPSLRRLFLDGRKPNELRMAWAAGDVFTTLSDNFQETFGLTPIEAMAAGLPVVVSDWDGYKDTVRQGVDGFRVPTLTLPRDAAEFVIDRHDLMLDDYDAYCGLASTLVAVDVSAARDAYGRLFANPDLRRQMGEAGRKRVREDFDWGIVIGRYIELWKELDKRRNSGTGGTVPRGTLRPDRMNPFTMFRSYPSVTLSPQTKLALREGLDVAQAAHRMALASFRPATSILSKPEVVEQIITLLAGEAKPLELAAIMARLPAIPKDLVERTAVILAKCGVLAFAGLSEQA
jgi:alpha-maltose-1-phosphate synthase